MADAKPLFLHIMKFHSFIVLVLFVGAGSLYAQQVLRDTSGKAGSILLEDIWQNYKYVAETADDFRWMTDDKFFSRIEAEARGGANIWSYNVETGNKEDALVKISLLPYPEGITWKDIADYEFDFYENKVLLKAKVEHIYRHSTRELCMVYSITRNKMYLINDGKPVSLASFSPEGDKLAYVYENNIFYTTLYDTAANYTVQVTTDGKPNKVINGIADWVYEEEFGFTKAYQWSPDGRFISYYRFDESKVPEFSMQMYTGLYPEMYTFKYPKAGEPNSDISILIYNLKSKNVVTALDGRGKDLYVPLVQWTNAKDELAIVSLNRLQNELQVLAVEAADGANKVIYSEKSDQYIEITDDKWLFSDDGQSFVWQSEADGYNHIYIIDRDGNAKQVTKGDWEVTKIVGVDQKHEKIYYLSTEGSPMDRQLFVIGFNGKGKKRLTEAAGVHEVSMSSDFTYYVDTYSSLGEPPMTVLCHAANGKQIKVLEDNGGLRVRLTELDIAKPEFFTFETAYDKIKLNGWMIKPKNFDPTKEYPVLMHVYGGPGSQTALNEWGGFNYMWHLMMAQHGYIIVSVDGRGTGGRGAAFKKATYGQLGKLEALDQIHVARYLQSLPYVNQSRIGIWGWSFGGYLTSLCMVKGDGIFRAGIAVAPVTNWRFYDTIYTERYLKKPQDNPSGYDQNSPLNFARDLKGRYLLVHGTADDNVHVQNTMEWINALVKANKQFDQFIYPNRNHGIYGGNTRFHLYKKMTDFVIQNL